MFLGLLTACAPPPKEGPNAPPETTPSCPSITVEPDTLAWSGGPIAVAGTAVLTLTNTCDTGAWMEVTPFISEGAPHFTVSNADVEVGWDRSVDLTVSFTPPDAAAHTGVLSLGSNDPVLPMLEVPLTGVSGGEDIDGDGHLSPDDCDDLDAAVHPGAEETWYDGVDQDCDGANDHDQDGDGINHDRYGGIDCDDTDASVNPMAAEEPNLVDDDCDGLVDEDFVRAGDVLVTEVLHDPWGDDAAGEWFEVFNTTQADLDLSGWELRDAADTEMILVGGSLVVPARGYAVFAADAWGGATHDYDRDDFQLDASDAIRIFAGEVEVFTITWGQGWEPAVNAPMSLDPDHLDVVGARASQYWCVLDEAGTPGATNGQCAGVDE